MLTFITGPVRAGKSTLAERLARECELAVVYCATAAWDDSDHEWSRRIERHRERRPPEWRTIETAEPHGADLVATLRGAKPGTCLLIESLGTWVASVLARHARIAGDDPVALAAATEAEVTQLIEAILQCGASVIVVSEEVGWGVVPPYIAGRVFRDVMGRANQRLAAGARRAYLVVSGIPIDLKPRDSS
jgi:adenosylcobinamide kinase/adenosylcobinamide-phosphate guanylyltransferase